MLKEIAFLVGMQRQHREVITLLGTTYKVGNSLGHLFNSLPSSLPYLSLHPSHSPLTSINVIMSLQEYVSLAGSADVADFLALFFVVSKNILIFALGYKQQTIC